MYKYTTPTFTLTLPEGTDLGVSADEALAVALGVRVALSVGLTYPTGYPAVFDI